jgi:metal-sulfur cluster biosynthetic enzyme
MIRLPHEDLLAAAWDCLRCVRDPELGVNLVDLGLVYDLALDGETARMRMTLTAPGCPLADSMPAAVARALEMVPGISHAEAELVWEPRWEPEMMTHRGREELGWR